MKFASPKKDPGWKVQGRTADGKYHDYKMSSKEMDEVMSSVGIKLE